MPETFSILPLAALTTLFLTSIFFFLFIIFYLFATKCFYNIRHHHHLLLLLRRITLHLQPPPSETNTNDEDPFIAFSPSPWRSITNNNRGLHNADIQHIPTLQFKQKPIMSANDVPYDGCVVCLNKFKEQDVLRVLPACGHGFHLDCIDIWLQSNANCPLSRINISGKSMCQNPTPVVAPSPSPQSSRRFSQMGDEDFVVIELGGNTLEEERVREGRRGQEISIINRDMFQSNAELDFKISNSNARKEQNLLGMMGDEYIDVREKNRDDFFFPDQPIRRSFSMDSAVNKQQIYSTVQAIIQQNRVDKQIRLSSFRKP